MKNKPKPGVVERRYSHQRQRLLKFLTQRGPLGATDEECQLALHMKPYIQHDRRRELEADGLVAKLWPESRPNRSGRLAWVWVTTAEKEASIRRQIADQSAQP